MAYKKTLRGKKVLITCGPTWVPIDGMRVLSNHSTGEMGHKIAEQFLRKGADVTVLEGAVTHAAKTKALKIKTFCFFDEFWALFKKELKKDYAVVIHAAAVSDFKLKKPYRSKINSDTTNLRLNLVPTIKIINRIKSLNKNVFLVGFKLEDSFTPRGAVLSTKTLFKNAGCDLVVANNVRGTTYNGFIVTPNKEIIAQAKTRTALANRLVSAVKKNIATAQR